MEKPVLNLANLAVLLGRSPQTIKMTFTATAWQYLRTCISETRLLRWRRVDVDACLASHVESRFAATDDK